jgi:NAD(P)-dependent dehydrogenase (short-subunit alcohol dehydrogenase family)
MRLTHYMLGLRNAQSTLEPCVIYFAGGGTNNATPNYSAYTLSKIALIKMCELLHAEIPDVRFTIVGPGWVNTKIHQETLQAGTRAGANYARTVEVIQHNTFTAMERVLDCCDWLSTAPRSEIGGRNFSVAHDAWGTEALRCALRADPDMYKLRRAGNALTFSHPMQQA